MPGMTFFAFHKASLRVVARLDSIAILNLVCNRAMNVLVWPFAAPFRGSRPIHSLMAELMEDHLRNHMPRKSETSG